MRRDTFKLCSGTDSAALPDDGHWRGLMHDETSGVTVPHYGFSSSNDHQRGEAIDVERSYNLGADVESVLGRFMCWEPFSQHLDPKVVPDCH